MQIESSFEPKCNSHYINMRIELIMKLYKESIVVQFVFLY